MQYEYICNCTIFIEAKEFGTTLFATLSQRPLYVLIYLVFYLLVKTTTHIHTKITTGTIRIYEVDMFV